jgi:hypothetical protein
MYRSTKENKGNYTFTEFIKRGMELVSIRQFNRFRKRYLPKQGGVRNFLMMLDYYGSLLRYGAIVSDYFEYQFWKKTHIERSEYVTMLFSRKIQKLFNKGDKTVFIDKIKFNKTYSRFRSIKSMDLSTDEFTAEDFVSFVKQCDGKILMKPLMGASGRGIFKPDVTSDEKAVSLFKEIKTGDVDYMAEELFIQTGSLHEANPSCLNTVRIFTLFNGKEVYLMCAGVRIGGGKGVVDNIHSGGMVCELEKETGTIIGPGYNLLGEKFVHHPVSGILLPGLVVPNWDKVLKVIREAAMVSPNIGHTAWDVAVSETDVTLIEANEQGNFDLIQSCSQRGCKRDYLKVIKGDTDGLMRL